MALCHQFTVIRHILTSLSVDQLYQRIMRSKRTVRSRQPTERTAVIDLLRAVWLSYCHVVLCWLAAEVRATARDEVVGGEA